MKKLLLSVAVLTGLTATAQIPDYGVFPSGVVFTDINGGSHDIDAILDGGQSVIIDAFADWCGPCWNYHITHTLEDVHNNNPNVQVFGVEADPGEAEANISNAGTGAGDWTQGVTYPLVNDDNIATQINLAYYPTLILVCPDRSVTEVGQVSEAQWNAAISACSAAPTNNDDPRLIDHETTGTYLCGGASDADVELNAVIQNYTAASVTGTYTVKFFNGATEIATTDANLTLDAYETELVTVGTVSLPSGTSNLTARITSGNDDTSNDEIAVSVSNTVADTYDAYSDGGLTLEVTFDNYASEFGYVFDAGLPPTGQSYVQIHNDAAGGITTPLVFSQVGSLADTETDHNATLPVATSGCYYLMVVDSYGDGLTFNANGALKVTSGAGMSDVVNPAYDDGFIKVYDMTVTVGLDENTSALTSASVYPNPATDVANISLELANNSNVSISLINSMGQVVYNNALGNVNGTQSVQVNTSSIEAGMYFVNITVDGVTSTERISITK